MNNHYRTFALIFILITTIFRSGCATIRTMPSLGSYGAPKVMSGTRLDYNAATDDQEDLKKFSASAPDSRAAIMFSITSRSGRMIWWS